MAKAPYILYLGALLFALSACALTDAGQVAVSAPMPSVLVVEEVAEPVDGAAKPSQSSQEVDIDQIYNEYSINLTINPETNIVRGNQRVSYINKTGVELDQLSFNLPLNAFSMETSSQPYFSDFRTKIFPGDRDYGYMDIIGAMSNGIDAQYLLESSQLTVFLDAPLAAGKKADVSIQFEAYVPVMNHRTGSDAHAMWMGAFLPTLCVYENGEFRFDTYYPAGDPFYTEVANYSVNITAPSRYRVVATGVESVKEEGELKTTSYSAKLVRDFTFALLDRSYNMVSRKTASGTDIHLHYRSNLSNVDNLVKNAETALNFFEEYVGGYPYGKVEIVETGLFLNGGMEFSQVIFMDSAYLTQPESLKTIVHEVGHQWFYNIVGSDPIQSAWMDEGLVSLLQEKIYYPELESFQAKFEADYNSLDSRLANLSSLKLSADVSEYKDWTNYYNIQYTKGKLMIYGLNMKMGEEKFIQFIRAYYSRYSYKIASMEDFISTAEEIYGEDLSEFFDGWLNGEKLPPLYQ